jgi:hypothetical protein
MDVFSGVLAAMPPKHRKKIVTSMLPQPVLSLSKGPKKPVAARATTPRPFFASGRAEETVLFRSFWRLRRQNERKRQSFLAAAGEKNYSSPYS